MVKALSSSIEILCWLALGLERCVNYTKCLLLPIMILHIIVDLGFMPSGSGVGIIFLPWIVQIFQTTMRLDEFRAAFNSWDSILKLISFHSVKVKPSFPRITNLSEATQIAQIAQEVPIHLLRKFIKNIYNLIETGSEI